MVKVLSQKCQNVFLYNVNRNVVISRFLTIVTIFVTIQQQRRLWRSSHDISDVIYGIDNDDDEFLRPYYSQLEKVPCLPQKPS